MWLQVKWPKPVSLEGNGSQKGLDWRLLAVEWSYRLQGNGLQSVLNLAVFSKGNQLGLSATGKG